MGEKKDRKEDTEMLQVGTKGTQTITVTPALTAKEMGSGALEVLATPAMIALMEKTAWTSVQPDLEEGWGTVGTRLEVDHLSATPLGMEVTRESVLTAVEGRKLTFTLTVRDQAGEVGRGNHERFLVQNEKFQAKANAKGK